MTPRIKETVPYLRRPAVDGNHRPLSVLLLHGMGGGPGNWDSLTSCLPTHLEIWDVKMPWSFTGDPSWAEEPRVTQCVSDPVDHLRRSLGKDLDIVIAHSLSANVVLELLSQSDSVPAALTVLISPFYRTGEDIEWKSIIPALRECYSRLHNEIRKRRRAQVSSELREAMVRRAIELTGDSAALRFYEIYQRTPELKLESITTRVMLIAGGDDADVVRGIRALSYRIPRVSLEILAGCGHFPMIERAREVADLIEIFVNRAISDSTSD